MKKISTIIFVSGPGRVFRISCQAFLQHCKYPLKVLASPYFGRPDHLFTALRNGEAVRRTYIVAKRLALEQLRHTTLKQPKSVRIQPTRDRTLPQQKATAVWRSCEEEEAPPECEDQLHDHLRLRPWKGLQSRASRRRLTVHQFGGYPFKQGIYIKRSTVVPFLPS